MTRTEYFNHLGNNCRVQRMKRSDAQTVIDNVGITGNDWDSFWEGYLNGTCTEVVRLPLLVNLFD